MIERRTFLFGVAGAAAASILPGEVDAVERIFDAIRVSLGPGARLGVAAIDTGTRRRVLFDANGRYALCSTFKLPLVAAILVAVQRRRFSLSDRVPFSSRDLLSYAPRVQANVQRGWMTFEELCAAAVEVSDNSAANLLLARIGGPAGLTHFIRSCGDMLTRLDRTEPDLNSNIRGDLRDTTTPLAMMSLSSRLLTGRILSDDSRLRLVHWLQASTTGRDRLRAAIPTGWIAGDKTGTGANGAANDVAILWPPRRGPILIASYLSGGDASPDERNKAHAAVAREVIRRLV